MFIQISGIFYRSSLVVRVFGDDVSWHEVYGSTDASITVNPRHKGTGHYRQCGCASEHLQPLIIVTFCTVRYVPIENYNMAIEEQRRRVSCPCFDVCGRFG